MAAGIPLLNQLLIHFSELSKRADPKKEFHHSVTKIVVNGKSTIVAGLFSLLAMLCFLISLGIVVSSGSSIDLHVT
jgi:hypothetical protein